MPIPTREELKNRYSYHKPEGNQPQRYEIIRQNCLQLAETICDNTPFSREQATALTHLDSVMMFANAAIARNE